MREDLLQRSGQPDADTNYILPGISRQPDDSLLSIKTFVGKMSDATEAMCHLKLHLRQQRPAAHSFSA